MYSITLVTYWKSQTLHFFVIHREFYVVRDLFEEILQNIAQNV
jgi:hypothetical protein